MKKRSEAKSGLKMGVSINGMPAVHAVAPGGIPKCNISSGAHVYTYTDRAPDCERCLSAAPSKVQRAYMQGWRHGTKEALKAGPANQKDDTLRAAYLQGYDHGYSDFENADQHMRRHYAD